MLTTTLEAIRRLLVPGRRHVQPATFAATRPLGGQGLRPNLIFRLKAWPQLPEDGRTAEIYRILSVMSSQPVNRQWLLARCSMSPRELDRLMLKLVAEGAVEVIDPSRFARGEPCRA